MNQGRIEQQGAPDQVYDHPATPFVLKFLGDVNLLQGQPGVPEGEVSYVRPHELEVLAVAGANTLPVTLSQTLTVGAHTRLEFKRPGDGGYVDVELLRADYVALRDSLALTVGAQYHLQPRRVTRFVAGA
jgi:sulfate transport system ATP-binding protein